MTVATCHGGSDVLFYLREYKKSMFGSGNKTPPRFPLELAVCLYVYQSSLHALLSLAFQASMDLNSGVINRNLVEGYLDAVKINFHDDDLRSSRSSRGNLAGSPMTLVTSF